MGNNSRPNLIALIPAYNEESHLAKVIAGALKHLPVLVIDDGSTDQTGPIAAARGAIVVRQTPNQGKVAALRTGFRFAIEHDYQGVITLDADGQHDPEEIPAFLEAYQHNGFDLIVGRRDFSRIPPVRHMANSIGQWSFSWALGKLIPDNQSGYRLISARLAKDCLSSHEKGFEFEVEMIVICTERGYPLGWVPIRTIYAGEKSHIQPLHHAINYARLILQTRRRVRMVK